jgi:hypothetical protein
LPPPFDVSTSVRSATWALSAQRRILDPAVVADPAFGCRFTQEAGGTAAGEPFTHQWFDTPCPQV